MLAPCGDDERNREEGRGRRQTLVSKTSTSEVRLKRQQ
jgi:hypothetical protein